MPSDPMRSLHAPLPTPRAPAATVGPQHPPTAGRQLGAPRDEIIPPFIPMTELEKRLQGKMEHTQHQAHHHHQQHPPVAVDQGPPAKLSREKQDELLRTYQTLLLQWHFVQAKSQAVFEVQQSKALSETQLVVLELQRLRQDLAMKLMQQRRKDHLQKLDRVLHDQTQVYAALLPMLERFDDQYSALSRAVHFSRHRVGLNDVDVSGQDSDTFLSSSGAFLTGGPSPTQTALNVSSRQLARATALLQPHLSTFLALEQSARGLVGVVQSEAEELTGLYELVRQAWELEGSERGLRIEDMQRGKAEQLRAQIILPAEQLQHRAIFRY